MSQIKEYGKVAITFEGEFDQNKSYEKLCIVEYGGMSFLSKVNGTTSIPTQNKDEWIQLSVPGEKGDKGDVGDKGDKGDKGDTGLKGISTRTIFVYKHSETVPDKPVGGSFDFVGGAIRFPEGWQASDNIPSPVWRSERTFFEDDSIQDDWSTPMKITGDNGKAGVDGVNMEFIYKVTKRPTIVPDISNMPSENVNDYVPVEFGWSDSPHGVTATNRIEWVCTRKKVNGVWTKWEGPTIWSAYGEKGQDGDGVEYIYFIDKSGFPPSNPTPEDWEYNDEYQNTEVEYVPRDLGWKDEPTGVSDEFKFEWQSQRKIRNGIWQPFTDPTLWSKYGDKGNIGDRIVEMFAETEDHNPPNVVKDNINPGSIWSIAPPVVFDPSKGGAIWSIYTYVDYKNEFVEYEVVENEETIKVSGWSDPIIKTGYNGEDGINPNYRIYIYKKSDEKPELPTFTDPTKFEEAGWKDAPYDDSDGDGSVDIKGRWWECSGLVNGESGEVEWQYIREINASNSKALFQVTTNRVQPECNKTNNNPGDLWKETYNIPNIYQYVWMITGEFDTQGNLIGEWQGPTCITGETPYINEDGNWEIGGEDTGTSAKGENGITPIIGEDGYWYFNGVKSEYSAIGDDGHSPYIKDGYWWEWDADANKYINTNIRAEGVDGITPTIGENGNWEIGGEDTGIPARGELSVNQPKIINGYWYVYNIETNSYENTGISAEGKTQILNTNYRVITNTSIKFPNSFLEGDYYTVMPSVDTNGYYKLWNGTEYILTNYKETDYPNLTIIDDYWYVIDNENNEINTNIKANVIKQGLYLYERDSSGIVEPIKIEFYDNDNKIDISLDNISYECVQKEGYRFIAGFNLTSSGDIQFKIDTLEIDRSLINSTDDNLQKFKILKNLINTGLLVNFIVDYGGIISTTTIKFIFHDFRYSKYHIAFISNNRIRFINQSQQIEFKPIFIQFNKGTAEDDISFFDELTEPNGGFVLKEGYNFYLGSKSNPKQYKLDTPSDYTDIIDPIPLSYINFDCNIVSLYYNDVLLGEEKIEIIGSSTIQYYLHTAYSNYEDGTNYSQFLVDAKYIGIYNGVKSNFNNLTKEDFKWSLFRGNDGAKGLSGIPGVSLYLRYWYGNSLNISSDAPVDRTKWYINPKDIIPTDANPYIWFIQGEKTYNRNGDSNNFIETITWTDPVLLSGVTSLDKIKDKVNRKIIYPDGLYGAKESYICTDTKAPYVLDSQDGNYYVYLKTTIWDVADQTLRPSTDYSNNKPLGTNSWEKFEMFEAIYSGIGVFGNALVGSAVFNGDYMFSQQGIDKNGNPNNDYENFNPDDPFDDNNNFYPNVCINFKKGIFSLGKNKLFELSEDGSLNIGNFKWDDKGNQLPNKLDTTIQLTSEDTSYTPSLHQNENLYLGIAGINNFTLNLPNFLNIDNMSGKDGYLCSVILYNYQAFISSGSNSDISVTIKTGFFSLNNEQEIIYKIKPGRYVTIHYYKFNKNNNNICALLPNLSVN